jgi:hypothetical protein
MIVDLESWEEGYDDGLRGRPAQYTPGLDRLCIRAATFRRTHIVTERKKGRVMLARQPNGPLNDTVAALG